MLSSLETLWEPQELLIKLIDSELNIKYKQTILLITHDPDVAAMAGRIIEMRDGKILNRVENLYYTTEQKQLY